MNQLPTDGKEGYGKLWCGRRRSRLHRLAYETFVGSIPEGHLVLHHCDNPPCWRPSHLWTGTHADNMADMMRKGRSVGRKSERSGRLLRLVTEAQVLEIQRRYAGGESPKALAREFGIWPQSINYYCRHRRKTPRPVQATRGRAA